jgi:elongation factor Ts
MAITAEMVKKLRDQTGAGMMDCKKALTETGGDYEKAVALLREKGIAVAAKREAKSASEGLIACHVTPDAKAAVLLEANCETTFVAKTDEFVVLAKNLAKLVAETGCCADVESLMGRPYDGQTVRDRFNELMGKIGEKMAITRFVRVATDGVIGSYVHTGEQIAVLVELKGAALSDDVKNLAKDIAMHISWSNPDYLSREDISPDVIENEREIQKQRAMKEGKPENIVGKIVDGRISKEFFSRVVLLEQPFIKDEEKTIKDIIDAVSKKVGESISVASYVRYRVGETAGD